MSTVFEARASTILYRLAAGIPDERGLYLLPANICPVVPLALLAAGRRFEFIDLDAGSLCPSEPLLERRLRSAERPPVAGLVYARSYGAPHDARGLFLRLKERFPDILLIDDRCLSVPEPQAEETDWQGSDVILFSTGYAKPVDLGFGGFAHLRAGIRYSDRERAFEEADLERVTALYKAHIRAATPIYRANGDGAARDRLARLRWLDTRAPRLRWSAYRDLLAARAATTAAHRANVNRVYREWIPAPWRLDDGYHGWRFQVRVPDPERLLREILAAGFFASRHYFPSATLFGAQPCPQATRLHASIVNLFNDLRVTESEAGAIGRIVRRHVPQRSPATASRT